MHTRFHWWADFTWTSCLIGAMGPFIYYVSTFLEFFGPPSSPNAEWLVLSKHVFSTENKQKLAFSDLHPYKCLRNIWMVPVWTLWHPITFQLERNWVAFRAKVGFLLNHTVFFIRTIGALVGSITLKGTWNRVPLRTSVGGIIDTCNKKQYMLPGF